MSSKKKTTAATVAGVNKINYILPSAISLEVAIWQLRIMRAKSHPQNSYSWCQLVIQEMEEWSLLLPTKRSAK